MLHGEVLNRRRKQLGMSYSQLAQRSRVSEATVKRMLSRGLGSASFDNVMAVAKALGLAVRIEPEMGEYEFRREQATRKAKRIVRLVQGTSALELQAVDGNAALQMVEQTVHELMAGSRRRLWAL